MASLGAPGGCAQQGHESRAEEDHCIRVAPSLGGLARSCQGFQSSSAELGGHSLKKRAVREWWRVFIPETPQRVAVYLSYLEYFSGFESQTLLFFLVAIVK